MTMKNLLPSSWSRSNSICFTLSSRASRVFFSAGVSPLFASASAAAASAFFLAASLAASFSRLRASFAAFFSALDGGARNAGSPNVSTYLPKHSKPAVAGRGEGSCVARFKRPLSPGKAVPGKICAFGSSFRAPFITHMSADEGRQRSFRASCTVRCNGFGGLLRWSSPHCSKELGELRNNW